MRSTCRHCFENADYINVRTTLCPGCSPAKDKSQVGEWVHRSTKDGTLADARAKEMVKAAQRQAMKDAIGENGWHGRSSQPDGAEFGGEGPDVS